MQLQNPESKTILYYSANFEIVPTLIRGIHALHIINTNRNETRYADVCSVQGARKAFRSTNLPFVYSLEISRRKLKFVFLPFDLACFPQVERSATTKCNYRPLSAANMLELHSNASAKYDLSHSGLGNSY